MFESLKLLSLILLLTSSLHSQTNIVYNIQKNEKSKNRLYGFDVLKLALNKTTADYGEYKLSFGPKMNRKRVRLTIKNNKIKNYISKISVTEDLLKKLSYANFPVDRGTAGYRVSFISSILKKDLKQYDTLQKIKKLTTGQGVGWLDIDILKYNGFNTTSIGTFKGLLNMTSLKRIDFFPRGINEITQEYHSYKYMNNLNYDETFMLYYPLPRFFFTNKSNGNLMKRIEKGLIIAYEDGSLNVLFNKYYKKNIDFLNLNKRVLYKLKNPFLKDIDTSYEKYIFNPLRRK